jgi:hypothetical protein
MRLMTLNNGCLTFLANSAEIGKDVQFLEFAINFCDKSLCTQGLQNFLKNDCLYVYDTVPPWYMIVYLRRRKIPLQGFEDSDKL